MILACPICCFIPMPNGRFAMVDPEDWIDLHKYHWYLKHARGGTYAYRKIRVGTHQMRLYMHREITHAPKGTEVHHKNRNTLDNRKANLVILTPEEHYHIGQISHIIHRRGTKPEAGCEALPVGDWPATDKNNT